MDNGYKILKKELMNCPLCGKTHELELRESIATLEVKGDRVYFKEKYYICNNLKKNNCFEKDEMSDENLLEARDAYRKKNQLLTSKEIKAIRNKFKLTQADFAIILGLGEVTITRYETKQIQDVSIDQIIRFVNDNPFVLLEYLEKRKDKFSDKKYNEIKENIKNSISKELIEINNLKIKYINFDEENEDNGNCILDIDKLSNVVAYIANKMQEEKIELKKVVLMKILWYIDALRYKKYNKSLTGLVYVHEEFGALPIGHEEIMYLPSIEFIKKQINEEQFQYKIFKKNNYKIKKFDSKDQEIIDKVINKFKNFRSSEIADYMHKEDAYKNTMLLQIIPFSLTKTLNQI